MGIYDRDYNSEYAKITRRYKFDFSGNSVFMLIAINLLVFVTLRIILLVYFFVNGDVAGPALFNEQVMNNLQLPAYGVNLLQKPWTLFTYMFTHFGLMHILGNMLWLWWFGTILKDVAGDKIVVPLYIYGGLAGAFFFILAYTVLPVFKGVLPYATMTGASAGIMAIAMAATILSPGYRIFPMIGGGIPLWVLMGVYLLIDLVAIPDGNAGGRIAHLAGAAMGFVYISLYKKGTDIGRWMNNFFDWVNNLFNPAKPKKGKVIKSELFYKSKTEPFKKTPNLNQQRIDAILDKINQRGYSTLSEEEKELLKKAGEEL